MKQLAALLAVVLVGAAAHAQSAESMAGGPLAIVSREDWQAKPPLPGMIEHKIRGIVLHHTATRGNPKSTLEGKMRGLQSFSQARGKVSATSTKPAWPDVPYHFYIDVAGRIAEGRDVRFAGDTNTSYDPTGQIQIVLEGDFEKEIPSSAQLDALRGLLVWALHEWHVEAGAVSVHKDHAPTACPGRNLLTALPEVLARVVEEQRRAAADPCRSVPQLLGSNCMSKALPLRPTGANRPMQH